MKKITITNTDNTRMSVDLVRYFKFNNDCFLIFNKGEIDEKGYHKLYLVRIMEELGFPVVQTIGNERDWAGMQNIVKKVIKDLKRGKIKNFEDLDYKTIDGIKVENPRFFKLDQKLTDILSSNYCENENTNSLESIDTTIMNEGQFNPGGINIPVINNIADLVDVSEEPIQNIDIEPIQPIEPVAPVQLEEVEPYVPATDTTQVESNIVEAPMEPVQPIEPVAPVQLEEVEPYVPATDTTQVQSNVVESPMEPIQPIEPVAPVQLEEVEPYVPATDTTQVESNVVEAPMEPIQPVNTSTENATDYETLYKALKAENEATNIAMEEILNQLLKYKEKYGEIE